MRVAAIQLTSKGDKKKNLARALGLMSQAALKGAELIALPEYFSCIGTKNEVFAAAEKHGEGEAYRAMQDFAREHKVFVLAGTIAMRTNEKRLANRSILFDPRGKEISTYDKIHLFDTDIPETGVHRESLTFRAGSEVKVARTKLGEFGFSVCYDLRFPELFRELAFRGAKVVFVPSAFTKHTGKAHWLTLLRARAIENQVFIVAPAQIGKHREGKVSFGKSCIIDPWGEILAIAPNRPGFIIADLDFKLLGKVRHRLPVLSHYRKDLFNL